MSNPYGNQAYHQTSINTASREQILLMLYEACIRFFKRCKKAMEEKDFALKGEMLGKAQDIVNELCTTLDFDKGGDIAKQLEGLYLYVFMESTEANISNDPAKIQHCIGIMETLHEGWKGAVENLKEEQKNQPKKKLDIRSE